MSRAKSVDTTAERFIIAYAELAAFQPTFESAIARRDQEIARRTGIAPHWSFRTDGEAKTHLAVQTIVEEEMGIVDLGKKLDALYARLDPIVNEVIATPAEDISCVGLKANAVATAMPHLWESAPNGLDYPDQLLRDLIESFCVVTGVELFARPHSRPRTDLN
jgi:hypothetical protein